MHITVLPALQDNYIYLIRPDDRSARTAIVDPGESAPVLTALRAGTLCADGAVPEAIIITHTHHDHIGGVDDIRRAYPDIPVYAPAVSGIAGAIPCGDGTQITLFADGDGGGGGITFTAMDTPGHCAHHLCWHSGDVLFSGDSLFLGGCGRILGGGSEAQMFATLNRIAQLPDSTKIYCGHEYTLANLKFAQAVEPDNAAIAARRRSVEAALALGQPSVPATLAEERETNPFLRTHIPAVIRHATSQSGEREISAEQIFKTLRHQKNHF